MTKAIITIEFSFDETQHTRASIVDHVNKQLCSNTDSPIDIDSIVVHDKYKHTVQRDVTGMKEGLSQ